MKHFNIAWVAVSAVICSWTIIVLQDKFGAQPVPDELFTQIKLSFICAVLFYIATRDE